MNERQMLKDHKKAVRGSFTIIIPNDTSFQDAKDEITRCMRSVSLPDGYIYRDTNTSGGWIKKSK
jgi:hypothetical protein